MSYASFNNRFFRANAVVIDALGIDPLLDRLVDRIAAISTYTNHEVSQDERGAPDLISFVEYDTEDFWWHIMVYNGICRYRDIKEGTTLRIPDYGALISATNDMMFEASKTNSTDNIAVI